MKSQGATVDTGPVRLVRPLLLLVLAALVLASTASAQSVKPRIIEGTAAAPGEYPWQVFLRITVDGDTFQCGGSLVSATHVLTAQHCIDGAQPSGVQVRANSINRTSGGDLRQVSAFAVHPFNDPSLARYDVAVLTLSAPVPNAKPIVPVEPSPSPDDALWETGDQLTITGWGQTESGTAPTTLLQAVVPRVSDPSCQSAYPTDPVNDGDNLRFDAADMVCAVGPDDGDIDDDGADTCFGDSGGPIVAPVVGAPSKQNAGDWRLVGVTSWGPANDCGDPDLPGVYARLGAPAIADWLANAVEPVTNTGRPTISGALETGSRLTCAPGTWTGRRLGFDYEFLRVGSGGVQPVQRGSDPSLLLGASDVGSSIFCRVTARNSAASASADSDAIGPVVAPPPPVVEPPVIPPPVLVDRTRPRARVAAKRCSRRTRRCTVTLAVADPAPSSGIDSVEAVMRWRESRPCTRLGRRTTCVRRRSRSLTATRLASGRYRLRTPRLRRGIRYRLAITAIDREGNEQLAATATSLRLRR